MRKYPTLFCGLVLCVLLGLFMTNAMGEDNESLLSGVSSIEDTIKSEELKAKSMAYRFSYIETAAGDEHHLDATMCQQPMMPISITTRPLPGSAATSAADRFIIQTRALAANLKAEIDIEIIREYKNLSVIRVHRHRQNRADHTGYFLIDNDSHRSCETAIVL